MAQSQTVENYLKTIFQAQMSLEPDVTLVPMGQLATALGVVPGTATTMVKALADSGLAHYEPYVGVRLTPAGEKLAALVLRRHRLVELFLVKVMGMSWADVHDEAENLEHAVSDRLIDRIDEMLGRPSVDPHGDPIPDPEGALAVSDDDSLLTCPLGAEVTISRVRDQDRAFLQFAEEHDLRPGDVVRVEDRSAEGDSVQLRGRGDRQVTIGARAASKVLVRAAKTVAMLLLAAGSLRAQTLPAAGQPEPFRILDNSFLVEEAFNQEPGIFQNIVGGMHIAGGWAASFSQEWPIASERHQFSYTLSFLGDEGETGVGDALVHYRYQALREQPGRPAFSPRFSVLIPSASRRKGLGAGSPGLQGNLPFSKQTGDWYWHWNAGLTWIPRAEATFRNADTAVVEHRALTSPFLAASSIYRVRPMLCLMLESVVSFDQSIEQMGSRRQTSLTLSPGMRTGWNIGDKQAIVGFAVPTTWTETASTGAFVYFSYELPFARHQ